MRLWFICMMAIWCIEVSSRNPIFNRFLQDNSESNDEDYYSDSTEKDTDEDDENLPLYEYYEQVMQDAFEFFGESQETISMVKQQLNQASGEDINGLSRQLHKSLQNANDLINQKTEILREKFRLELTYSDMTNPIEESTVKTLLNLWKEVKQGLEQLRLNKDMDGVEELQKVLDNMDRKTRSRYEEVRAQMAKIDSIHHNSNNLTHVHNKKKVVENVNNTRTKLESLRGRTSL